MNNRNIKAKNYSCLILLFMCLYLELVCDLTRGQQSSIPCWPSHGAVTENFKPLQNMTMNKTYLYNQKMNDPLISCFLQTDKVHGPPEGSGRNGYIMYAVNVSLSRKTFKEHYSCFRKFTVQGEMYHMSINTQARQGALRKLFRWLPIVPRLLKTYGTFHP